MSETVERVGEALRQECLKIFGATWSNDNAWRLARAAIEAMREPTDAMKKEGAEFVYDGWAFSLGGRKAIAKESWQAMIDEALK